MSGYSFEENSDHLFLNRPFIYKCLEWQFE